MIEIIMPARRGGKLLDMLQETRRKLAAVELDADQVRKHLKAEQEKSAKLMRMIESLTPGGSEFHNDPERCIEFNNRKFDGIHKQLSEEKSRRMAWEISAERAEINTHWICGVVTSNFLSPAVYSRIDEEIATANTLEVIEKVLSGTGDYGGMISNLKKAATAVLLQHERYRPGHYHASCECGLCKAMKALYDALGEVQG